MKTFFKVGKYEQWVEIENRAVIDFSCLCSDFAIRKLPKWEKGDMPLACKHIKQILDLIDPQLKMATQINHKENNKLRIRNADPSFTKHEVVKLLIMIISRRRYPNAGVYSEFVLVNQDIVDVFVDLDGHDRVYYEVQKDISNSWMEEVKNRDLELGINTQVIKLNEVPENLKEMESYLEKVVI